MKLFQPGRQKDNPINRISHKNFSWLLSKLVHGTANHNLGSLTVLTADEQYLARPNALRFSRTVVVAAVSSFQQESL